MSPQSGGGHFLYETNPCNRAVFGRRKGVTVERRRRKKPSWLFVYHCVQLQLKPLGKFLCIIFGPPSTKDGFSRLERSLLHLSLSTTDRSPPPRPAEVKNEESL